MGSTSNDTTLRILHLPPQLSNERRDDLFREYGAVRTQTLRNSEKHTITFAEFPSYEKANEAFLRLHQLNIKGYKLSVEFAKKSISSVIQDDSVVSSHETSEQKAENDHAVHFKAFLKKLNGWAPQHSFTQPPPPNLYYKYPPPTRSTLFRIAIQLVKEPTLYTQVLHLMNKMNLPPPFEELEAEFPIIQEAYDVENYADIFGFPITPEDDIEEVEMEDQEGSEMESDNENNFKPTVFIPMKRKKSQLKRRKKIPKLVNRLKQVPTTTSNQKPLKPEDMFEIQKGEARNLKIDVKTVNKLPEATEEPEPDSTSATENAESGFGLMFPADKDEEASETAEAPCTKEFINSEELAANRISVTDQRVLPVFKNYHPGKPSCRLYIKNLSKSVEEDDLHYIYKRYIKASAEGAESQYCVRLMQEGRMKGQAFVTLQNLEQSQLALDETNGFILKDKPMVVQFAKKAPNS